MGFQTEENEHNLAPAFLFFYFLTTDAKSQLPRAPLPCFLHLHRLYPLTGINPPFLLWLDVLSQQLENKQLQDL